VPPPPTGALFRHDLFRQLAALAAVEVEPDFRIDLLKFPDRLVDADPRLAVERDLAFLFGGS